MSSKNEYRSGFVNIIGKPNVGKSTLMNALVGEKMSIITPKPQTTRHRIIGIVNGEDYQIVFSDTPGIIDEASYKLQAYMNKYAFSALEDADALLFMVCKDDDYADDHPIIRLLSERDYKLYLIINKVDKLSQDELQVLTDTWTEKVKADHVYTISALKKTGISDLMSQIVKDLPEGPQYYDEHSLTDRPMRFFVSEIIREKILQIYRQEIPYASEVIVHSYETGTSRKGEIIRIEADIHVTRRTQKEIMIGKNGAAIKKLGTEARKAIESFTGIPVFLALHVRIKKDWRDDERQLKHFGYQ